VSKLSTNKKNTDQVVWKIGYINKLPHWLNFGFILATSWFLGIFILFRMYQFTDISFTETLKWFAFFAVVVTLIPYKWVLKVVTIEYTQLLGLNIIGFGPFFTGIFLLFNMVFASNPTTNTFAITDSAPSQILFENHYIVVELEGDALKDKPKFRRFDQAYLQDIRDSDSIIYTISSGVFGYDVLEDYELVSDF